MVWCAQVRGARAAMSATRRIRRGSCARSRWRVVAGSCPWSAASSLVDRTTSTGRPGDPWASMSISSASVSCCIAAPPARSRGRTSVLTGAPARAGSPHDTATPRCRWPARSTRSSCMGSWRTPVVPHPIQDLHAVDLDRSCRTGLRRAQPPPRARTASGTLADAPATRSPSLPSTGRTIRPTRSTAC